MKKKVNLFLLLPALLIGSISLSSCNEKEFASIDSRIGNIESDITTIKQEIESLKTQIKELQAKLASDIQSVKDDYSKKISDLEKEIVSLNNSLVLLKEEFNKKIDDAKTDYNTKINNLNDTFNNTVALLEKSILSLESSLSDLSKKHDEDKKALEADYSKKISDLESSFNAAVAILEAAISENEKAISDLSKKHDEDKQALEDDYNQKFSNLDAALKDAVEKLEGEIGDNSEAIAELTKKHDEDKKTLEDDYNKKISDLDSSFQEAVTSLEEAIKNNMSAIAELSKKHDEDKKALEDDYNQKISDLDSKYESEVLSLQSQIDEDKAELSQFKEDYAKERQEIVDDYTAKIKAVTDDYSQKIEEINAQIKSIETQISDLQTELEGKIQTLKDTYDAEITSLTSRVSALEETSYCTVTFDTCGGTVIEPQILKFGSHLTKPKDPSKEDYDFNGWKFNSVFISDEFFLYYTVDKNITITADFSKHNYSFEVSMSNDTAGYFTVNLESGNKTKYKSDVPYGTYISLTAYELGGSTFTSWTQDGEIVSTDKTYSFTLSSSNCNLVANYTLPPIECKFVNYDGSLITTQYVEKGTNVIYLGEVPTKPKTGNNYNSWNGWDKSLNNINENTTFTAQFKNTGDTYYHYCVFVNYDGEQLWSDSTFSGGSVSYKALTPTRPQDVEGTNVTNYTFSSWDKSLGNISEATTFVAKYSSTKFTGYKVDFVDSDSTSLYSYYCKSGTNAVYPYNLPFSYDATNVKMFTGWNGSLKNITEPKTFVAQYMSISRSQNGEYPTSLVKDTNIINELDKISITDSKGYKTYNGNKYLQYSGTSYTDNDFETVTSGNHYYLVEPIQWKYLATEDSNVLVTTEYLLDAHRYNESYSGSESKTDYQGNTGDAYANNYKFSEIRTWLNTDFVNQAFTDSSRLVTSAVDNSVASTGYSTNPYVCLTTNDKVFLLSYKELTNKDYRFSSELERQCKTTEYARARGTGYSTYENYMFNGYYWTRSPDYFDSIVARYVHYVGDVDYSFGVCNSSRYAVRLALRLSL